MRATYEHILGDELLSWGDVSSETTGELQTPVESALSSGQWVDLRGNQKTPTAPLKLLIMLVAPSFAAF